MRISVTVKLFSHEPSVHRIDETHFDVRVREKPVDGKANTAVIRLLASYLDIAPSRMHIVSGQTSRHKVIDIR